MLLQKLYARERFNTPTQMHGYTNALVVVFPSALSKSRLEVRQLARIRLQIAQDCCISVCTFLACVCFGACCSLSARALVCVYVKILRILDRTCAPHSIALKHGNHEMGFET